MRIISWNLNGIRAVHKKGLFLPLIEKYDPDIICLQETKSEKDQIDIDLPSYEEFWNSAEKRGYSGTAIFVKKSTKLPKTKKVLFDIPEKIEKKYKSLKDTYGDPNREGRVIALETEKFFLVDVYTPNAKDDLSRVSLRHNKWDPAFLEYVKSLANPSTGSGQGKPVIFCGDLNVAHTEIDLARPKQNVGKKGYTNEEREGIDNIIDSGFVDAFRIFEKSGGHYTWWSHFAKARERNVGWRIDYFFVSKNLVSKVKDCKHLTDYMGSDHCPIMIDIMI
ncbi:MAG: exodeoxyribonuclease III [Candidatus Nomurabacteria bacterium]|nr:MAG: exodeoxyribonuclease III [Candidatus Nomurabacteria bacterium]